MEFSISNILKTIREVFENNGEEITYFGRSEFPTLVSQLVNGEYLKPDIWINGDETEAEYYFDFENLLAAFEKATCGKFKVVDFTIDRVWSSSGGDIDVMSGVFTYYDEIFPLLNVVCERW